MKHSPAAERNKDPILNELKRLLPEKAFVLEVGSYSGQHAMHFASNLSGITWQPSDVAENHADLAEAIANANLPNLKVPLVLDATDQSWSLAAGLADVLYTANTMHIMGPAEVEQFFRHLPAVLEKDGMLIIYGPFKFEGKYTSESNQDFDQMLQSRGLKQGLRDAEYLEQLAKSALGLALKECITMPANNNLLVFR